MVPFGVCYGFGGKELQYATQKGTELEGLGRVWPLA